MMQIARLTNGYCDHPTVLTRTNVPGQRMPAITMGPNPVPTHAPLPMRPATVAVQPGQMAGVPLGGSMAAPFTGNSISRPLVVTPM